MNEVARTGQQRFSDLAISTTLTLRLVFRLPLRQAEGFVRSVLASMDVDLEAPDHTTLSRRSRYLAVGLHRVPVKGPIHLIVDSTGLSIAGEGEWATAKHGGRGQRGWKKLHLGVDGAGVIVAHTLTEATVDDATTGVGLIEALHADLARVTADAAYDTIAFYAAATARDAIVVVPPNKAARVSRRRPRSSARDRTIRKMKQIGRRQRTWAKAILHRAYRSADVGTARRLLTDLARRLETDHPRAAESVREGLDETLTVLGLNLPDTLRRSLTTTTAAESLISRTRHVKRTVTRWRGGQMVVRGVAAGVLEAVKGFRRLKGHKAMPQLVAALRARDQQLGLAVAVENVA